MSLALFMCQLFVSLMQSVNGAEFLSTTCLFLMSVDALTAVVFRANVVHITSIYV